MQPKELEAKIAQLQSETDQLTCRTQEAERARIAAEKANRTKSEFLAVMSHELRTPLNAIAGYVELLLLGIHGPVNEAQRDALVRIQRSEQHLLRLINDVLDLARLETGRVEYVTAPIALADVVATAMPMVEPQLSAKHLACDVRVAPDAIACADREKVQQILLNVLTNAIKFTPFGGRITVATTGRQAVHDQVFLRVVDTGIGIPRDKQEAVFEPFVQVDARHAREYQGTGLGLAISRDLARGMGGDLRVRSVLGKGSMFTLSLPTASLPIASMETPYAENCPPVELHTDM